VPTAGAIEYRAGGESMTLALVHAAMLNQGDGWRYTTEYLERAIDDAIGRSPDEALISIDHAGHLALIKRLAERTADLHRALAVTTGDPAFDPEPLDAARLGAWAREIAADLDRTFAALREQRDGITSDARELVDTVLAAAPRLEQRIERLAAEPVTASATRFHGDYHLSQVLLMHNDFVITDLEGEPGRPVAERRVKRTPLKDVAGMLRSFDYARVVTARHFAAKQSREYESVGALLDAWRGQAQATFIDAYRAAIRGSPAYPRDDAEADRLIALALIERLLYEVRYELGHRPDWLAVPLQDLYATAARSG
jgi:maltose alpha-D-glucosyltransferase/alpha-amylase